MEFYTLGVYESTEEEFFNKLAQNNIDTFLDIRLRRGVRGAKYAFVNSTRLQEKLANLGIDYFHIKDLAPSKEIRQKQKDADKASSVLKSTREKLGCCFIEAYEGEVLTRFDFNNLFELLRRNNSMKIALFCVEAHPDACHRSLVGNRIIRFDYPVAHL
mgnify:CR=1 FL=1